MTETRPLLITVLGRVLGSNAEILGNYYSDRNNSKGTHIHHLPSIQKSLASHDDDRVYFVKLESNQDVDEPWGRLSLQLSAHQSAKASNVAFEIHLNVSEYLIKDRKERYSRIPHLPNPEKIYEIRVRGRTNIDYKEFVKWVGTAIKEKTFTHEAFLEDTPQFALSELTFEHIWIKRAENTTDGNDEINFLPVTEENIEPMLTAFDDFNRLLGEGTEAVEKKGFETIKKIMKVIEDATPAADKAVSNTKKSLPKVQNLTL